MTSKVLTKPVLKLLSADITAAIEPLKKKYGLSEMVCAGGTFEGGHAKLKVHVQLEGGMTREEKAYHDLAHLLGLPRLDTNPMFKNAGTSYKVVGLNRLEEGHGSPRVLHPERRQGAQADGRGRDREAIVKTGDCTYVQGYPNGSAIAFHATVSNRSVAVRVPSTTLTKLAEILQHTPHVGHAAWHLNNPAEPLPCKLCKEDAHANL